MISGLAKRPKNLATFGCHFALLCFKGRHRIHELHQMALAANVLDQRSLQALPIGLRVQSARSLALSPVYVRECCFQKAGYDRTVGTAFQAKASRPSKSAMQSKTFPVQSLEPLTARRILSSLHPQARGSERAMAASASTVAGSSNVSDHEGLAPGEPLQVHSKAPTTYDNCL